VVDLLAAGGADILAVWEISRSSRDRAVFAALLTQCTDSKVLIATGGRLHDPADADDGFLLDLTGALAVRESSVTSKRVQRATPVASGRRAAARLAWLRL
jgi:site-specific DNA recombinase